MFGRFLFLYPKTPSDKKKNQINPSHDVTINPHPIKKKSKKSKKIKFHLYTRGQSTPIRSKKKIKKKSNFTCTLDVTINPHPIKTDQKKSKKIKFEGVLKTF